MTDFIKKLLVKNIGLFDLLEIDFSPKMNIIIGANASGKTSILRYLTYCLSSFSPTSRFRVGAEFWVEAFKGEKMLKSGANCEISNDQKYRQLSIDKIKPPSYDIEKLHKPNNISLPDSAVPYNLLVIGANRFFDYEKINGMLPEKKGEERKREYNHKNTKSLDEPELPAIKQWMINRYFITDKDWAKVEKENWNRIINYLPEIAPNYLNFKFERIERDLEPMFSINNKICYLEELSTGFKSILSILFSIIDWCEGINEDENGLIQNATGTVLIDEIDTHLHPEWQMTITSHLKKLFPKIQFIVTTHSPHVIASADSNEVISIPKHDGTVSLKAEPRNFKAWQLDFIIEDLMNFVNPNELSADKLLGKLDKAIKNNDLETFDNEMKILKTNLHPNDPIITVYKIKRNKILLNK